MTANRISKVKIIIKIALRVLLGVTITAGVACVGSSIASAQAENPVVAIVNGRNISQKDVDEMILPQLLPLQEQIYTLRKATLENLITRAVLEDAAGKAGVSVDELKKQLTAGKVEVAASQVQQVYAENASVFGSMSPDEVKERLRLDLESQARMKLYREALAGLRNSYQIEVRLAEPRLPSLDDGDAPAIGPRGSAVTIIEFSDFQCPYCRQSQSTLKQLTQTYGNNLRLVFKHLPLDIHAKTLASAQAAFCAGEQGRFWPYHDALFTSENLSGQTLNNIASDLALNLTQFKECLSSEKSRAAVLKDVREARQFGISSTPTFVVNGKLVRGAVNLEEFKARIDRELRAAQDPSRAKGP